jgi:hypothetical protein
MVAIEGTPPEFVTFRPGPWKEFLYCAARSGAQSS